MVVAGDGVIGLAITMHLAARGASVALLAPELHGAASPASAGMLAPSVERTQGPAQAFGDAARDAWPRLRSMVERAGGATFEIRRDGILCVARTPDDSARLRATLRAGDVWLTADEARRREPALGEVDGAALYAGDGVVDAPAALSALQGALRASRLVTVHAGALREVARVREASIAKTMSGETIRANAVVIATGAWSARVAGLPRRLPVRPLRGVIVGVDGPRIETPMYAAAGHAYLFPRGGRTMIGATSDEAGFDATPAPGDVERLISAAAEIVPGVRDATRTRPLCGLRPMTPDGLPIIGSDPAMIGTHYACGHGRNGFLHAALTGEVVAKLVAGEPPGFDLKPFDPTRFILE